MSLQVDAEGSMLLGTQGEDPLRQYIDGLRAALLLWKWECLESFVRKTTNVTRERPLRIPIPQTNKNR